MSEEDLVEAALKVRGHAHAPYSKFFVGPALRTKSGKIFTGCNVENVSLGLTICAERAAMPQPLRKERRNLSRWAVVADSNEPAVPCGACRQVLAEFDPAMKIIVASTISGRRHDFNLRDLFPQPTQGILESFCNVQAAD
jgi:cytidine deaminase